MKLLYVTLFTFCALVPTLECSVIYRKYTRTVPPRTKSHKKVTEVVEIFGTYNHPPFYGSSEQAINLFLRDDAPPLHVPRTTSNGRRPTVEQPRTAPPSIYGNRPSTTIRPNPYENKNGVMTHVPQSGVTTTKFAPVPNFTIREPVPDQDEIEHTSKYSDEVTDEPTTEYDTTTTTEEPVTTTTEEVTNEPEEEEESTTQDYEESTHGEYEYDEDDDDDDDDDAEDSNKEQQTTVTVEEEVTTRKSLWGW